MNSGIESVDNSLDVVEFNESQSQCSKKRFKRLINHPLKCLAELEESGPITQPGD